MGSIPTEDRIINKYAPKDPNDKSELNADNIMLIFDKLVSGVYAFDRLGIGTTAPTSKFDIEAYTKIWTVTRSIPNSAGNGAFANIGYFNIGTYHPFNMEISLVAPGSGGGAHRYILNINYNNKQDDNTWRILTPLNTVTWANDNITYLEVKNTGSQLWFRVRRATNMLYDHTYKITFIVYPYVGDLSFVEDSTTGTYTSSLGMSLLSTPLLMNHYSGNVGIGTTSPGYKLDVNGSCHASSFPTSSDERFKTDVKPINDALNIVMNLQGVRFKWNYFYKNTLGTDCDTEKYEFGVIAQETEKVAPEVITKFKRQYKEKTEDGKEVDKEEEFLSVDYGRLVAVLIEAIKEQQKQINELRILVKNLAK
jgi:hypothetical protein